MNTELLNALDIKIEEDTKELIHQLPGGYQEISIMKFSVLEDDAAYQAALDQELIPEEYENETDENLFMWRVEDDYTAAEWYARFSSAVAAFTSMLEYYYDSVVETLDEEMDGMIDCTFEATPDDFAQAIEVCLMNHWKYDVSPALAGWIVAEFRSQWPGSFASWYAEACHIDGSEVDVHVPADMLPLAVKMAALHKVSPEEYIRNLIERDVAGYRTLRLKKPEFDTLTEAEIAAVTGTTTLQEAAQAGIEFLTDGDDDDL